MIHTIIFATNNENKVREVNSLLPDDLKIMSLKEAGIDIDIPEPHHSLEENAKEKSSVIHSLTNQDCFSEDSGLEIEALNGEPGVLSARYAGVHGNALQNMNKVLEKMKGMQNRNARFRTVISLIIDKQHYLFEGICEGHITESLKGGEGFGYDPIFIPGGTDKTFGEMSLEEKNIFSHRKKATLQLINFLKNRNGQNKT